MENFDLLSELVKIIEKEKIVFERELASFYKEQAISTRNQEEITNKIRNKERDMITQEKIDNYKSFWKSLMSNNAPPCPFCFIIHNIISDLQAEPEMRKEEHFRCKECGKWFHVSLP